MVRVVSVGIVLLFSGLCALIFQVAWIREYRLVFGGTTAATGAVLAIFMGGLGIGNACLGRYIDRHPNPLRFYAKLELVIALSVAVSPLLIDLTREIYIAVGGQTSLGLAGATVFRLFLTSLVLGVPTVAMGGTLPAAVRAVTSPADERRRAAAFVYGLNTLGAVVGVCLSTFYLLEAIGTERTLYAACSINLLIAATAFVLSWTLPAWDSEGSLGNEEVSEAIRAAENNLVDEEDARAVVSEIALPPRMIYASAGIVGFAFFLMELVWYRMLTPLLGGDDLHVRRDSGGRSVGDWPWRTFLSGCVSQNQTIVSRVRGHMPAGSRVSGFSIRAGRRTRVADHFVARSDKSWLCCADNGLDIDCFRCGVSCGVYRRFAISAAGGVTGSRPARRRQADRIHVCV